MDASKVVSTSSFAVSVAKGDHLAFILTYDIIPTWFQEGYAAASVKFFAAP